MGLGAIVVPLNPSESPENLRNIFFHSGARLLLHSPPLLTVAKVVVPESLLVDLNKLHQQEYTHSPLLSSAIGAINEPLAVLLYTSGTTSKPKGVLLSHEALLLNAEALQWALNLTPGHVHLCVLPLFHANAWGFSMIATFLNRGHLVLCDTFPLLSFWEIVTEEKANVVSLVPTLLKALCRRGPVKPPSHLRYVVSAAAPLPVEVAKHFYSLTKLRINQGYGLSECTNFATIMPPNIGTALYEHLMHDYPQTCIGTPLYGTEIFVIDKQGGVLGPGERGQLVVRGPTNMLGYWSDSEKTVEAFSGGWLNTGDEGYYITEEGHKFYFITGRYKDMLIRQGENISPVNIESQLQELHELGDYVVVGFANVYVDEEVGLWIDSKSLLGTNIVALRERILAATAKIPFFQRPKVVLIGETEFAKTSVGKVKRSILVTHFARFYDWLFRPSDALLIEWLSSDS